MLQELKLKSIRYLEMKDSGVNQGGKNVLSVFYLEIKQRTRVFLYPASEVHIQSPQQSPHRNIYSDYKPPHRPSYLSNLHCVHCHGFLLKGRGGDRPPPTPKNNPSLRFLNVTFMLRRLRRRRSFSPFENSRFFIRHRHRRHPYGGPKNPK